MTVDYRSLFRMPNRATIAARSSSITNSFINGFAPAIEPTAEQVRDALAALGMEDGHVECAYCGDACTEWDHLNPLVRDKKPTGFITEIHNLVPSCGKCNQSKGNKPWRQWMVSDAKLSPFTRGVPDIYERMRLLDDYEKLFEPIKVDFKELLGDELWARYWKACDDLQAMMRQCQTLQDAVSAAVREKLNEGMRGAEPQFLARDGKDQAELRPARGADGGEARSERASKTTSVPSSPLRTERQSRTQLEATREAPGMISDIVRNRLIPNVKRLKPDDDIIRKLEKEAYCRAAFGISYAVLVPLAPDENASDAAKDRNGKNRYWVNPIYIGGQRYLVCSQWYDRQRADLLRWLKDLGW